MLPAVALFVQPRSEPLRFAAHRLLTGIALMSAGSQAAAACGGLLSSSAAAPLPAACRAVAKRSQPHSLTPQGPTHAEPTHHTMNGNDPSERYERGREQFSTMFRAWLAISGISYSQIRALGAWAVGANWISTSQLTKMRNDRSYSPHFKFLDALAQCNEAIRVWREEGPEAARARYGPIKRPLAADLLDGCVWLADPEDRTRPLDFLDLCAIFVGKKAAPVISAPPIAADRAAAVSDAIGRRLDSWLAGRGGLRAGFQELLTHYDVADQGRIDRLRDVVIGAAVFDAEELEEELPALIWLFSEIEGRQLNRRELLAWLETSDQSGVQPETPARRQRTRQPK